MLTLTCARVAMVSRHAVRIGVGLGLGLGLGLSIMVLAGAAHADGVAAGGCVGDWNTLNCAARWGEPGNPYVRTVPQSGDEAERTRAAERDRKWEARCKPVIAQDRYGVPRYRYAAPGCEFGVIQ